VVTGPNQRICAVPLLGFFKSSYHLLFCLLYWIQSRVAHLDSVHDVLYTQTDVSSVYIDSGVDTPATDRRGDLANALAL
jgi:hypothetical protein